MDSEPHPVNEDIRKIMKDMKNQEPITFGLLLLGTKKNPILSNRTAFTINDIYDHIHRENVANDFPDRVSYFGFFDHRFFVRTGTRKEFLILDVKESELTQYTDAFLIFYQILIPMEIAPNRLKSGKIDAGYIKWQLNKNIKIKRRLIPLHTVMYFMSLKDIENEVEEKTRMIRSIETLSALKLEQEEKTKVNKIIIHMRKKIKYRGRLKDFKDPEPESYNFYFQKYSSRIGHFTFDWIEDPIYSSTVLLHSDDKKFVAANEFLDFIVNDHVLSINRLESFESKRFQRTNEYSSDLITSDWIKKYTLV